MSDKRESETAEEDFEALLDVNAGLRAEIERLSRELATSRIDELERLRSLNHEQCIGGWSLEQINCRLAELRNAAAARGGLGGDGEKKNG